MHKTITAASLFLLFLFPPHARASDYISGHVPNSSVVGKARMSVYFWDVYDATLYAPKGQWNNQRPFALSLQYLRKLSGKKIADRSIEEIRNQGFKDEITLAIWHRQLTKIFTDVDDKTVLTGILTENKQSLFYKNGELIGRIKDPEFGQRFFDIWLGQKTSKPDFRKKLLGSI